jgi:XTP/dITP diphosphohydrolase
MRLVVATGNKHKLEEIRAILDLEEWELTDLSSYPDIPEVEEDGDTFEHNALKKARETSEYTGEWAMADDSGLEVDALDGSPGVWSARYAGEPADHSKNNEKLLKALENTRNRAARFRCVIAVVTPDGQSAVVSGTCDGKIALQPAGNSGFGYDPVFVPLDHDLTFAELGKEAKNRISHRGRALELVPALLNSLKDV